MGVRPPDDGGDDGPEVVEFGIAALDAQIEERDLEFPVTADQLESEHGDLTVPIDAAGTEITLGDALSETGTEQFDTERELLDVLHPVFERRRQETSRGLVRQLRALLPF